MNAFRIDSTRSFTSYFYDRPEGVPEPIRERVNPHSRPVVCYYSPKDIGFHHYGAGHPMKPHRLVLTNALVKGYGLDKRLHHIYDVRAATREEIEAYHDHDYIEFLSRVTPHTQEQDEMQRMIEKFNCGDDCPIFAGMYDFSRMYAGASLAGARKLAAGATDIAINWSGGLHHAKRGEASGFCFINDAVLAILELLRYHPRVLYIDIDIHHGDGVELAFYQSNRVMTVSFHKYGGDFFPGTGKLEDNGHGLGKYFCLNVPLLDGIDDTMYLSIFKSVIGETIDAFQPSSIVLQCGADSLGCDRIGAWNLSIVGHGECVNYVRKFNLPLLVLGGGGYTIKNVSRCWTYETAVLVGAEIEDRLPSTVYDAYFHGSNFKLHPPLTGQVENRNTPSSLQRITVDIRNKLRYLQGAPSVAMQEIPPDLQGLLDEEERTREERDEEVNGMGRAGEIRFVEEKFAPNEFYNGDNDVDQETPVRRGTGRRPGRPPRSTGKTSRGRGKGRASVGVDDDTEDMGIILPLTKRARAPTSKTGRGVGRPPKRRNTAKGKEREVESEDEELEPEDALFRPDAPIATDLS